MTFHIQGSDYEVRDVIDGKEIVAHVDVDWCDRAESTVSRVVAVTLADGTPLNMDDTADMVDAWEDYAGECLSWLAADRDGFNAGPKPEGLAC